jgi:hypothetical protein
MVAFELDHMLALVRRLDDAGHDASVQERWQGFSDCVRSGEAPWLAGQLRILAARIRRSTRIDIGPVVPDLDAGRLRQIFWLGIWLYRTATRRRVDLPELVFALRDVVLFVSALSAAGQGEERRAVGESAEETAGRVLDTATRRGRWQACARELWHTRPELEGNASATARAIVARLREEGVPNPGSVHTIRRFLAHEAPTRKGTGSRGVEE